MAPSFIPARAGNVESPAGNVLSVLSDVFARLPDVIQKNEEYQTKKTQLNDQKVANKQAFAEFTEIAGGLGIDPGIFEPPKVGEDTDEYVENSLGMFLTAAQNMGIDNQSIMDSVMGVTGAGAQPGVQQLGGQLQQGRQSEQDLLQTFGGGPGVENLLPQQEPGQEQPVPGGEAEQPSPLDGLIQELQAGRPSLGVDQILPSVEQEVPPPNVPGSTGGFQSDSELQAPPEPVQTPVAEQPKSIFHGLSINDVPKEQRGQWLVQNFDNLAEVSPEIARIIQGVDDRDIAFNLALDVVTGNKTRTEVLKETVSHLKTEREFAEQIKLKQEDAAISEERDIRQAALGGQVPFSKEGKRLDSVPLDDLTGLSVGKRFERPRGSGGSGSSLTGDVRKRAQDITRERNLLNERSKNQTNLTRLETLLRGGTKAIIAAKFRNVKEVENLIGVATENIKNINDKLKAIEDRLSEDDQESSLTKTIRSDLTGLNRFNPNAPKAGE